MERPAPPLLQLPRVHRFLVAGLLAGFAVLVAFGIHGFSLSFWHNLIDGSPASEVLFGKPQGIRSDDWLTLLPLALAQRTHEPPFPLINTNVGLGQSALVPFQLPVAHALVLLRPQVWGFFLGDDAGLAWMWWTQVLGVFYAAFLALMIVSRNHFALSSLGALALVCSPFLQFWSFNCAMFILWACLCFVAACHIFVSPSRGLVWMNAAVLAVAGGALLQLLYPPYQIVLSQLVLVLLGATVFDRVREYGTPGDYAFRGACLAAAIAFVGIVALVLESSAGDAIQAMRESLYPGRRFFDGGGWPLWRVFFSDLGAALRITRWEPLVNICEAASFWLLFPVVGIGLADRTWRRSQSPDPVAIALFAYCVLLTTYCVVGAPQTISRLFFWRSVSTERSVVALGLADLFLLIRFLAVEGGGKPRRAKVSAVVGIAWALVVAVLGYAASRELPELDTAWIAGAAALNGVLAGALFQRSGVIVVATLTAALAGSTLWFNPIARGGSAYLRDNPLSQAFLAIDAEAGRGTRWATFNTNADLLPLLGLGTLSGTFPVPQLALWSKLDPAGSFRNIYDRYAHVILVRTASRRVEFSMTSPDSFLVGMPLEAETLRRFGATHVALVTRSETVWGIPPGFIYLRSVGRRHFFKIAESGSAAPP